MARRHAGGRQADIADAILRIAGREGIGALTMERLARELGVTSGALFRHFPSRASMLNEAARVAAARLDATFPEETLPPLDRLRQFLIARAKLAAQHGAIPQLVFSEQFGKSLPPKGSRAVRDAVLRTRDFVVLVLREAATRGEIRRDLPPQELALAVIGSVFARSLFAAVCAGDGGTPEPEPRARWESMLKLLRPPAFTPEGVPARGEMP